MITSFLGFAAFRSLLCRDFAILSDSCAAALNLHPDARRTPAACDCLTIPGLGKIQVRGDRKGNILVRFGRPVSNERRGADTSYHVLAYPVTGENQKLLLLFHEEELLGVFREGAQHTLERTICAHEKSRAGSCRSGASRAVSMHCFTGGSLAES